MSFHVMSEDDIQTQPELDAYSIRCQLGYKPRGPRWLFIARCWLSRKLLRLSRWVQP